MKFTSLFLATLLASASVFASSQTRTFICTQDMMTKDSFQARFTMKNTPSGIKYEIRNLTAKGKVQTDDQGVKIDHKYEMKKIRGQNKYVSVDYNPKKWVNNQPAKAIIEFLRETRDGEHDVYIHMHGFTIALNGGQCVEQK